jgi:Fe-S-cluster-containing dehydrogenase component/CRP-like cAMP-binding protein
MPELEIAISRPQRWDVPFGQMTESDVDRLLRVEPFRNIDPSAFPSNLSLRGVLLGDTRLVHYSAGDIIVREGDYGNSAFLVLSGSVRVVLDRLDPELLGRDKPRRRGWLRAIAQLWENAPLPERRSPRSLSIDPHRMGSRKEDGETRVFLQDFPQILESTGTATIGRGEIFGEVAALSRTQSMATVLADEPAELLEIRWQGLRDLMRRTPALREHIEQLYRENSLRGHLLATPLLKQMPPATLEQVVAATMFESYGNFDWNLDFAQQTRSSPAEQIASEPLIAAEGDRANGLLLIRSGFARVSQRHGHGHRTLAYLGKGQIFGWEELAESYQTGSNVPLKCSLRAVGYVDILRVPASVMSQGVFPSIGVSTQLKPWPRRGDSQSARSLPAAAADPQSKIPESLLDFLADRRFLNGTQTMLIDLDRCTRCDDCVRACAATHDNNPRFIRQGPTHDGVMVANACLHCADPVCMIGCPTGAISRDPANGTLQINDRTCIGCSTCANNCPYQAIRMVEIRDRDGAFFIDSGTQMPIVKATKCDFCASQMTGPACQHACPHDALVRMDLGELSGLKKWLER